MDARINTSNVKQISFSSLRKGDVFVCAPFKNHAIELQEDGSYILYNQIMSLRNKISSENGERAFGKREIILVSRKWFDDPTVNSLSALNYI